MFIIADPCYNYQNLGDANRKSNNAAPKFDPVVCDDLFPARWYFFVRAAETSQLFRSR